MKQYLKAAAGVMALITAVTAFAGCSDSSGNNTNSGDATSATTTTTPLETNAPNSGVQDAVSNISADEDMKDIKVDTKIKWMAWWRIDETTPAVETFKTLYGVPQNKPKGYEETEDDAVFVNILVSNYADRYTQLGTYISSDDSPDCFPFEINYFPYSVYKNLFQSVDGIIDTTTPEWEDYAEDIAKFNWAGKTYCPIMDLTPASLLWYRKSVIDNAGLEDPWELFEKGEWTWKKFMELCVDFADADNGKYALDGFFPCDYLVATTGVPLIGIEDGKLVSNLNNPSIEKCMEMIHRFDNTQEALRYPRDVVNNWQPSQPEWVNGNTLFFDDGIWRYEEHWQKYARKYDWDEDEVNFVPYPRMDDSDVYYQQMKQDSIMLVAGAKNIEGYKAWIYANLLSTKDEDVKAAGRQQSIENYHWTEELLDRLDVLKDSDTFVAVFDFKNGIGDDIASTGAIENPVQQLTQFPYMKEDTYTKVRAENEGLINTRIEEMNKAVSGS